MSSTAVAHARFSVQQLSLFFGFGSLKKWDALYDVCQDNFSIVQHSESPLELSHVANLKKLAPIRLPLKCQRHFYKLYIATLNMVVSKVLAMVPCIA
jgi:hypothetical protein